MIKKIGILFLMCSLVLTCGCQKENEKNSETDKKNDVVEQTSEIKIIDINSNSRPYAVVINNYPSAVKVQTGLSDAYMVYEFPVEGNLTRSLAFFKDKYPTKVGTIRSARHNFLDYALENDAIFVHFGWSFYAEQQIPQLGINNIDGNYADPQPFFRENPEKLAYEHTAYGNLESIKTYATNKGYRQTTEVKSPLKYTNEQVNQKDGGQVANDILLKYSSAYSVNFKYNEQTKRYDRYVNGNAHTDYFTKEHYTSKNIIVVNIDYTYASNNYYLDLKNIGTGTGYYITNGYAKKITWEKKDRSSQTIYKYEDGTEIKVNDGNTFIMLCKNNTVTIK